MCMYAHSRRKNHLKNDASQQIDCLSLDISSLNNTHIKEARWLSCQRTKWPTKHRQQTSPGWEESLAVCRVLNVNCMNQWWWVEPTPIHMNRSSTKISWIKIRDADRLYGRGQFRQYGVGHSGGPRMITNCTRLRSWRFEDELNFRENIGDYGVRSMAILTESWYRSPRLSWVVFEEQYDDLIQECNAGGGCRQWRYWLVLGGMALGWFEIPVTF